MGHTGDGAEFGPLEDFPRSVQKKSREMLYHVPFQHLVHVLMLMVVVHRDLA